MDGTTDLPGKQMLDDNTLSADSKHLDIRVAQTRRRTRRTFWVVGLLTLLAASLIVHFHPAPWPYEIQTTTTMQQLQLWPWLITPIV
jgi:hypothetical protein